MPTALPIAVPSGFRAGYVAIIGRPNVGKSTLINHLLRFKLSIATAKPQTTRHRIIGIQNNAHYQIVYFDTPGLLKPNYRLQELMVHAAQQAAQNSDVILFVTDCHEQPHAQDLKILTQLQSLAKPIVLVINKVDVADKAKLLSLIAGLQSQFQFAEIFPLSALSGENTAGLEPSLVKLLPEGAPLYPQDELTEHPERFFVAEIIREKIFQQYGDEVPYSTAVVIDEFHEREGRKDLIRARIVVERDSQKVIILGKGASRLRRIGQSSRKDIELLLQRPVYLELWVAVKEKWRKNDNLLREMGYQQD
jgi:GTPase